jgi:Flp pilus assembly protein TadG
MTAREIWQYDLNALNDFCMKHQIINRSRKFRSNEDGVVLVLFTLMIVPILLVVAVAIDFGQTLVIKRQLAAAVDAAALSVAQLPGLDDKQASAKGEAYIRAHYPDASIGILKSFSVVRGKEGVQVSATAEMDTTFLSFAGYDKLAVTVDSTALLKQTKMEVVMVLDNTGSMGEYVGSTRKIDALKSASNTLVNILFGTDQESSYVKIGLVPFANAVNIGAGFRGTAIMDGTLPTDLNTEQVLKESGYSHLFQVFDKLGRAWGGCVRSRLPGHDLSDAPPSAADRNTLFTPYFAPDEPDIGYSNSYLKDGSNTGKYKKYAFYRDSPQWGGTGAGPNYNCPSGATQPLTNVKSTIITALTKMGPNGNTVVPEGLAWGWRVISPGLPFTEGVAYDDPDTMKVIILLTDGRNDVGGTRNGNYRSYFTSYGYADNAHMGATNGSNAEATLNAKLSTLCSSIKANLDDDASDQDIVLYTIGFGIGAGSTIDTIMRDCATEPANYFNTPSAQDLQSAFESIALGLSKLRLAK